MFDRRLGLFIHRGLYAQGGWRERELGRLGIPMARYRRYAEVFNPTRGGPEAWLDAAEAAGMTYLVFPAKHRDGFCLWDTKTTDFSIPPYALWAGNRWR